MKIMKKLKIVEKKQAEYYIANYKSFRGDKAKDNVLNYVFSLLALKKNLMILDVGSNQGQILDYTFKNYR